MRVIKDIKPTLRVGKTNTQIYDQGITYNEAGVSYNDARYAYGGIYGFDIYPLVNKGVDIRPRIVAAGDFQGTAPTPPTGNSGMLIGMLGLTYP